MKLFSLNEVVIVKKKSVVILDCSLFPAEDDADEELMWDQREL